MRIEIVNDSFHFATYPKRERVEVNLCKKSRVDFHNCFDGAFLTGTESFLEEVLLNRSVKEKNGNEGNKGREGEN